MRHFGHIAAVRYSIDRKTDEADAFSKRNLSVQKPSNPWLVAIIQETYRLGKFVESTAIQTINIYQRQIKAEDETDGRRINPRNPVQLNGSILDAIEMIEDVEPVLDMTAKRIEYYDSKASFESQSDTKDVAVAGINFSRTIIPRLRLFIHTYLWILWTQEALRQADQFSIQLQMDHDFNRVSKRSFPYIAHPPLIVATIACTTMIEEVGAMYINAYVDEEDYPPDKTRPGPVLRDLDRYYPSSDDFNISKIEEQVIESRNNVSHYITKRSDVIRSDDFETFCDAVFEGIGLVECVLADLIHNPLSVFQNKVSKYYID